MELPTVTPLTTMPALATLTLVPEMKLVPVNVTDTVAPCTPLLGVMEVRVGPGSKLTLKVAGPLMPPDVVTVTFVAPAAAVAAIVKVAVI